MVQKSPNIAHFNNEKESDLCIIHGDNKLFVNSKLLMNHSGFFKANHDFEVRLKSSDDKKMRILDLTASIQSYKGLFFYCLWSSSPFLTFLDDYQAVFDLLHLNDYFQFSEQFQECLLTSLLKFVKLNDSLHDQIYDIFKKKTIKPSVILKIALFAKVVDMNGKFIYSNEKPGKICTNCEVLGHTPTCSLCSFCLCNYCQKEHTLSHISIDVSDNPDAFFLFYLPAAYLCTIKYHTEVANFDLISFVGSLRSQFQNPVIKGIKNADPEVCKQIEEGIKLIFERK